MHFKFWHAHYEIKLGKIFNANNKYKGRWCCFANINAIQLKVLSWLLKVDSSGLLFCPIETYMHLKNK